jgi:hypothetical protein
VWLIVARSKRPPVTLAANAFATWTVVAGDGTTAWAVGARPSDQVAALLFQQASREAGRQLTAPAHPAVALVLQAEYEDSLQGNWATDAVLRLARDTGLGTAAFRPVCLARRTVDLPDGSADVYFVPFDAPAFHQFRADLTPLEPEHAGIGIYDPATLAPALVVAAAGIDPDAVGALAFDAAHDCEAPIQLAPADP